MCLFRNLVRTWECQPSNSCTGKEKHVNKWFSQTLNPLFICSYSCGYRKVFDEYSNIIHEKYPDLIVEGKNYDPPGMNMFIARFIVSILWFFIVLLIKRRMIMWCLFHCIQMIWYQVCFEINRENYYWCV